MLNGILLVIADLRMNEALELATPKHSCSLPDATEAPPGHVGQRLANVSSKLGIRLRTYDPSAPRANRLLLLEILPDGIISVVADGARYEKKGKLLEVANSIVIQQTIWQELTPAVVQVFPKG